MLSLTATLAIMLIYTVHEANSINSQIISQDRFSSYNNDKLFELKFYENYEQLRSDADTVVIYPIFTQSAYGWKGFHDFYVGYCNSCLTVKIEDFYQNKLASSGNGFRILEFLGYHFIDDIDIDRNPAILEQFDNVILLHNEFVTRTEFDAITHHPNVIYLYPNALSSEVEVDYSNHTITLVRGPGYPDVNIANGFDWQFDNTKYLDDWDCREWKFYKINNGYMLNCYPETQFPHKGHEILRTLKTL